LSEPAIASSFSNVATSSAAFPWNNFFTAGERALLLKNSFVVRPEAIGSFGQAYATSFGSQPVGSFVTVDAILHGLRVTADEAQRAIERDYLVPNLASVVTDISTSV